MRIVSRIGVAAAVVVGIALIVELVGFAAVPSWSVSASALSPASPGQVWRWYTDASGVPRWDHLVQRVTVNGPFATGTTGENVASNGMHMPWRLTDVVQNVRYTEISDLPLATMTATHALTASPSGTRIDHALLVAGPLAWVYRIVAYGEMREGIASAMRRLATGAARGLP